MSLVSSGLSRFLPFGAQERRQRAAAAAAAAASNDETAEIAAVEFADAFAQFNLKRRDFLLARQSQADRKGMMAQLPFETARRSTTLSIDEEENGNEDGATIAFAEEATASTSDCDYDYDYDKLKAVMPSGPSSMGGGLKRTVSSLHFRGGSLTALAASAENSAGSSRSSSIASSPAAGGQPPFCWHSASSSSTAGCLVQANQIEMEFLSMSAQPFELIVYAPSGERSQQLPFCCGRTAMFTPRRAGCGHGHWRFEICVHDANNSKKITKKIEEVLYFDGVGTLYFCVDANLRLSLTSQQFLRLPSRNRCCATTSLKHSATQPAFH